MTPRRKLGEALRHRDASTRVIARRARGHRRRKDVAAQRRVSRSRPRCPFAWRVQLAFAIKGIDHDGRLLSISAGDTKEPAFRALSPRGQVPVLVHGEVVLTESLAILDYLDRVYRTRPLFGKTPAEASRTWSTLLDLDGHFIVDARTVARACFRDQVKDRKDELREAMGRVEEELGHLAHLLEGSARTLDHVGAVDVVVYPALMQLFRGLSQPAAAPLDRRPDRIHREHAAVFAWFERFAVLPGVDATYPPHWREADDASRPPAAARDRATRP